MRRWPKVKWDSNDLVLISASLDHLDNNPKVYSKFSRAARLPLMILGAPGGWALRPTLAFYGGLASLVLLSLVGGSRSQLSILALLATATVVSYSYGTIRDVRGALIRLQILRMLRAGRENWTRYLFGYALGYLDSISGYTPKPGLIKRYLNEMRSLNRADEFFSRYSYAATASSVLSGVAFLFFGGAILALFFLSSLILLLVIIPISFSVSAWADVTRSDIPKVWHAEDLKVLIGFDEDEESQASDSGQ